MVNTGHWAVSQTLPVKHWGQLEHVYIASEQTRIILVIQTQNNSIIVITVVADDLMFRVQTQQEQQVLII